MLEEEGKTKHCFFKKKISTHFLNQDWYRRGTFVKHNENDDKYNDLMTDIAEKCVRKFDYKKYFFFIVI